MADETTTNKSIIRNDLFGRLDIYATSEDITEDNVINEVNEALVYHVQNLMQEDFLYWYRRNVQSILGRHKDVRPEIMNIVQMNHADEIVAFKNGYFLTQPAFYVSRNDAAQGKVDKLNEYLYRSGKQEVDNEVVNWFHTVGKAALYVEADRRGDEGTPIHAYALDPRSAFVVYSLRPGNEPVMGVNFVVQGDVSKFDVWTRDKVFHLYGGARGKMITSQASHDFLATAVGIESVEANPLGEIPIIEYRYNSVNMGAFESVVPLLDAINNVVSNRVDGVEQFIQSLMVMVNCELPEGATSNDVRDRGLIELKSVGENRADIKILTEQLDQTQTQVLIDDLYEQVLRICGMPSTTKGGTSTSDTGAAVLARDGWYQADNVARNTEDLFKRSNRQFDRILTKVLKERGLLDIDVTDFALNFVRNEVANIQSKAQACNTLIAMGMAPQLAFEKSGVSNDPVSDVMQSEKWLRLRWGDTDAPTSEEAGASPVKETAAEETTETSEASEVNEVDEA